jgi:heme A synthase
MTARTLNGLVLFGVLFQGLSAGLFMGHLDAPGWLRVHQVTAIATMVVALVAVIVAVRRRTAVAPTVGLLVLLVVQTGLGQAIAEGHRALVAAHVPIAVLLATLCAYLFVTSGRTRAAAPSEDRDHSPTR